MADVTVQRLLAAPIDPSLKHEFEVAPENAATMIVRLHEFATMAKNGELVDLAIVATHTDGSVLSSMSPGIGGAFRMLGALEMVKARWLKENIDL